MSAEGISDLVRTLLERRGITALHEISAFLSPDYDLHTHAPFLMKGMDAAVDRILSAIEKGERIAVYADFDCDGIPGAAILSDFFTKIGYENFEVYLPHRDREGYGLHIDALAALASRGVSLVVTVDVGTTAIDAVRFAREKGMDVVVTDHHEIPGELPEAIAVLNPKMPPVLPFDGPEGPLRPSNGSGVEGYPFPHLCGAAVAFKLVQALIHKGKELGHEKFAAISSGWEKWLLDLVAIATVADMVPLVGENRALAHWGLSVLRKSPRPGITALCRQLRLKKVDLTEDDIGFSIAPRINAASRMDDPMLALRLLTTKDALEAESLAKQLESLNTKRKSVVGAIVREAKKKMRERSPSGETLVLGNPDWKPALLGLAANSILQDRARLPAGRQGGVVCLWGRDANGAIKGSCRSDGSLSVVELFQNLGGVLTESGGHAASGGFTLAEDAVHSFPESLASAAASIEKKAAVSAQEFDLPIALREIAFPLYREIAQLSPFGVGNPKPIFRVSGVHVSSVRKFGKENNHVEVTLVCAQTGSIARAFDFFRSPEDFTNPPQSEAPASVLATLERDTYRGGLALRLVDVLPA